MVLQTKLSNRHGEVSEILHTLRANEEEILFLSGNACGSSSASDQPSTI